MFDYALRAVNVAVHRDGTFLRLPIIRIGRQTDRISASRIECRVHPVYVRWNLDCRVFGRNGRQVEQGRQ